jgi:hypothetical protein
MTVLEGTRSKTASGVTRSGRLFLLELSGDRIHSMNPDGSSDEHADIAPDLFTAETPLGAYQGIAEKVLSRTPDPLPDGAGAAGLEPARMAEQVKSAAPQPA